MESFLPFFITLFAGLFFSVAFKKIQVPWVIALIVGGLAIGPQGLDWFEVDHTIEFMSQAGLVLMMFMAGLETQPSSFKEFRAKMYLLAFINGLIPFLTGVLISLFFGLELTAALLVGILFISSSVAVVIPTLESTGLIFQPLGSMVLATTIVQDVASLIFLSIFLQSEVNIANLPLYIFYPLTLAILLLMRYALPKIQKFIFSRAVKEDDFFQRDIRAILVILFGVVILFELLGLHPIIAGFFAGLVLSESLQSEILLGKIRAISYGIFIPTFFLVVGMKTDLTRLMEVGTFLPLTVTFVIGSILSKLVSGTSAALIIGFNPSQSLFFGISSIPQLSTTLAASFTAVELGLLNPEIATATVLLSIVTTIVGPIGMSLTSNYVLSKKDVKRIE